MTGPQGLTGPQGAAGVSGYEVVRGALVTIPAGGYQFASATCPSGKVVIGGGESQSGSHGVALTDSYPNGSGGWTVFVDNTTGFSVTVTPYAVCVTAS